MYCYAYVAAMCTAVSVVRFEVPHHVGLQTITKSIHSYIYIYIHVLLCIHCALRSSFQMKTDVDDFLACSVAYGRSGFVLCGTMREILQ